MTTHLSPAQDDANRLYDAARHHARAAFRGSLEPWTAHGAADAATHAGSMVELLAKAILTTRDPRLLAKGVSAQQHLLDLVLQARGEQPITPAAALVRPTVDAGIAVDLVRRLDGRLAAVEGAARRVLSVRNTAVHMAIPPDEELLQTVVTSTVAFAKAAIAVLGHDPAAFWGEYAEGATGLVRAREQLVAAEAERLVEAARTGYLQFRRGLAVEAWEQVVSVLARRTPGADLAATVRCPACEHEARVAWSAEVDFDYSDGESTVYGYWELEGLHCPVCALELDGEQLKALRLADMPDVNEVAANEQEGQHDGFDYSDLY